MGKDSFASPGGSLELVLESAMAGDQRALRKLYEYCEPIVTRYVRANAYAKTMRWIRQEELVAWILEEVLCTLDRLPTGPPNDALLIRLRRVAFERIRDCHRNHRHMFGDSASPVSAQAHSAQEPSVGPVTAADDRQLLERLIEALPEKYALVVDLHLREGLDFAQIAKRLGMTRDGAYRQYKRARDFLVRIAGLSDHE